MYNSLSAPYLNNTSSLYERVSIGKDAKDLLILVQGDDAMIKSYQSLLENIMNSIGYALESEIYLSVTPDDLYDIIPFCEESKIQNIIDFGKNPGKLGLKIKPILYLPLKFSRIQFLYCDTIDKIHREKTMKNKLWSGLKKMFHD